MRLPVVVPLVLACFMLFGGCGGSQGQDSAPESGASTNSRATVGPTRTRPPPPPTLVPLPTSTPIPLPLLELLSFDCSGGNAIRASGTVRNTSASAFTNLGAQLLLYDRDGEGMIPFLERGPYVGISFSEDPRPEALEPDTVTKSTVPLEPGALQPGQQAIFRFPALADPFVASQSGAFAGCSVRFVECTTQCRAVPHNEAR